MSQATARRPGWTPRLILLEGMPGSGKSTAAQVLTRALRAEAVAARWWYEEQRAHPVFGFEDPSDARVVVDELRRGQFERAIMRALTRWSAFVEFLHEYETVAIVDGCLLGYLTWTLFWADAPWDLTVGYVRAVTTCLSPVAPAVIHLRPVDVEACWSDVRRRRGEAWTTATITRIIDRSPRCRRLGFAGFPGLVSYWSEFLQLADALQDELAVPWHRVDVDPRKRDDVQSAVMHLIGLPAEIGPELVEPIACGGRYENQTGQEVEIVRIAEGGLAVVGLPGIWHVTDLVPVATGTFDLRGLPWEMAFEVDDAGEVSGFKVRGPALLDADLPGPYRRQRGC